jgi:hypothetical protein
MISSDKASDAQVESSQQATGTQQDMFYQNREDMAPWRKTGEAALDTLWSTVQAGPGEFTESPGYQFRVGEGEKAINRAAAARGMYDSGRTMKALTQYNQDFATQEYDNWLNRWYQSLTPYQSMAGVGQTTAAQTAEMGQQTASNIAQNQVYAGNARASGYMGTANAINQGVDSGLSNWLMWRYMNQTPAAAGGVAGSGGAATLGYVQ